MRHSTLSPKHEKARAIALNILTSHIGEWVSIVKIKQRLEKENLLYGYPINDQLKNIIYTVIVPLWRKGNPIIFRPYSGYQEGLTPIPVNGKLKLLRQ